LSRNEFVAYQDSEIIGRTTIDDKASRAAKRRNQGIDNRLTEERKEWILVPPSNMTLTLHENAGAIPAGLVLSMPHEVGRAVLHKRLGRIIEHDVTLDAVIDGEFESAVEAMNLRSTR
jgi:hypothetical protein